MRNAHPIRMRLLSDGIFLCPRDCRLRVSFQGKRPHIVGAACGQVCGLRFPLDDKPSLRNSDPLMRIAAVGSASPGGSMSCLNSTCLRLGPYLGFGPAHADSVGGLHVAR